MFPRAQCGVIRGALTPYSSSNSSGNELFRNGDELAQFVGFGPGLRVKAFEVAQLAGVRVLLIAAKEDEAKSFTPTTDSSNPRSSRSC